MNNETIETFAHSAETDEDVIVKVQYLRNRHGEIDNYRVSFTCPDCMEDKVIITPDPIFQCDCGECISMKTHQELMMEVFESERKHIKHLREYGYQQVGYPISFRTTDLDGNDIIVMAIEYLGHGRWKCIDEDGEKEIICLAKDLTNPTL